MSKAVPLRQSKVQSTARTKHKGTNASCCSILICSSDRSSQKSLKRTRTQTGLVEYIFPYRNCTRIRTNPSKTPTNNSLGYEQFSYEITSKRRGGVRRGGARRGAAGRTRYASWIRKSRFCNRGAEEEGIKYCQNDCRVPTARWVISTERKKQPRLWCRSEAAAPISAAYFPPPRVLGLRTRYLTSQCIENYTPKKTFFSKRRPTERTSCLNLTRHLQSNEPIHQYQSTAN